MFKSFFTLLTVLLIAQGIVAQSVKLSLQKGQKFRVESSTVSLSSAEVMGQSMETNVDAKSSSIYEIINTVPEGTDLQSSITKLLITAQMMGQQMSFDSDKKDNEGPLAEVCTKLMSKPKGISLDNNGRITKQDKTDIGSGSQSLPGLGESDNATSTELFIPALSGKELKAGDLINDTVSVKKEKYSSADTGTYTVTKIENGLASITYSGVQLVNSVLEQMGIEMNSTSNNKITAELEVDIQTGIVLSKSAVVEVQMTIDAAGMLIPVSGKTTVAIKISPAL